MPGPAAKGDWGVPPLEPLSIRTANFDPVPVLDMPMSATLEPLDVTLDDVTLDDVTLDDVTLGDVTLGDVSLNAIEPMAAPLREPPVLTEVVSTERALQGEPVAPTAPLPAAASTAAAPAPAAAAAPAPAPPPVAPAPAANTSENQRIVTIRVCAVGDTHWSGALLLSTLENHGLVYGRYKVFHRKHSDGRTLFCAASLVEPGTFDIARMPDAEFRGVTLFAVLPGPADALETIDTLIETALELAQTLHGAVQDAAGAPLSAQRALALREDVAHFQRSLSMS